MTDKLTIETRKRNKLFKKFDICSCAGGIYKKGFIDGLKKAEEYYNTNKNQTKPRVRLTETQIKKRAKMMDILTNKLKEAKER